MSLHKDELGLTQFEPQPASSGLRLRQLHSIKTVPFKILEGVHMSCDFVYITSGPLSQKTLHPSNLRD